MSSHHHEFTIHGEYKTAETLQCHHLQRESGEGLLMEDCILLAYEFNWKEMEELHYHLKIGIEQVAASKKSIEDAVRLYPSKPYVKP